jgi:hypothetical protein
MTTQTNFTKTYDFDNLSIGSGLISSMASFKPSGYVITPVVSGVFNSGISQSNYIFVPSGFDYNISTIKVLSSSGDLSSLSELDFYTLKLSAGNPSGEYTVYGPYPQSNTAGLIKYYNSGIYVHNLPSGQMWSTESGVVFVDKNKFLADKTFEIVPDQESKLRTRLIFNRGNNSLVPKTYYVSAGKCFYINSANVFSTWSSGVNYTLTNSDFNVYDKFVDSASYLNPTISVKVDNIYYKRYQHITSGNINRDIEVTIPGGTEEIKLYIEDNKSHHDYYYRVSDYDLSYNDLRVQIDTKPSIPINNYTIPTDGRSYIDYASGVSLSVSNTPVSGYYDIIMGQYNNGQLTDYFVVGDSWKQINYRPLYCRRNLGLKFPTLNLSTINLSQPIELWIDIINIETDEAESAYANSIAAQKVREFYKAGDSPLYAVSAWPRRLGIKCTASNVSSLPTTPSGVSIGPDVSQMTSTINYNGIVGGLYKIDVKDLITNSILTGQSQPVLWLSFTMPSLSNRDKYIKYYIGNTSLNKPRLVFNSAYGPGPDDPPPSGDSGGDIDIEDPVDQTPVP